MSHGDVTLELGSRRVIRTSPGRERGLSTQRQLGWVLCLACCLFGRSDSAGMPGKSVCWARTSSKLPPLLAWVGATLERGGSTYPHICPSCSSKLQKGDSPRRKSSRGKCFCHTHLPSSFGFNFPFKLSAMLGPRWGTWSPSLSSDVWSPSPSFSSLSLSTVNLLPLFSSSTWFPLPQHL